MAATSYAMVGLEIFTGVNITGQSGTLYRDGFTFLHTYADLTATGLNTFCGVGAGNYTFGPAGGAANLGSYCTGIGAFALPALTTGYNNTAVGGAAAQSTTTGFAMTAIGYVSYQDNTTGRDNSGLGASSGQHNIDGVENVAIGTYSARNNLHGSRGVYLGYAAGFYETLGDKLFIDDRPRADEADARIKALVYGVFADTTALQQFRVNGAVIVGESLYVTTTLQHAGGGAGFFGTAPIGKPAVTGSKGANAALTSLMTALSGLGLVTDSTT